MNHGDATFVAPATPYGHSGIALIRLNGPKAITIIKTISKGTTLKNRTPTLLYLYDSSGNSLDRCLITYYKNPRSYTGDDLVEISCHGNPSLVDMIMDLILENGARLANPGEFTKRAFINGKVDILQAEAVGALIKSKTEVAAKIHTNTLNGTLSSSIKSISNQIITQLSSIEHAIDISEDEIKQSFYNQCGDSMVDIITQIDTLLSTFSAGKLINDGIRVVITGKPNVGKSTLLNYLSGFDKAIVSAEPGTTRDIIETLMVIDGVPIKYIDTAGVHTTDDKIEKMGIDKTNREIKFADLVLHINDDPNTSKLEQFDAPTIHILNKIDLHKIVNTNDSIIHISAKTGKNVDILLKKIKKTLSIKPISTSTPHLTTKRQQRSLIQSVDASRRAYDLMSVKTPNMELVAFELRTALDEIETLLGKTSPDDILNHVFDNLCVGK